MQASRKRAKRDSQDRLADVKWLTTEFSNCRSHLAPSQEDNASGLQVRLVLYYASVLNRLHTPDYGVTTPHYLTQKAGTSTDRLRQQPGLKWQLLRLDVSRIAVIG